MAAAVTPSLEPSYRDIDRSVLRVMAPPGAKYWAWICLCAFFMCVGIIVWANQIYTGLGVTGLTEPTMWAVYITNFVFWVGIAHSGTLISAILYLFRTRWRTAVYRCAETMTLFAVLSAGLCPLMHLGRVWFMYWLLPYPNERSLQPDFRSPLVWDAFAVSTYLTISALFLFMGLIPDVANAREASTGWRKLFYKVLSYGWRGTDEQWRHFSMAYLLLAGLATPLVLSVHSVVSWDFAMAQLPGWHSTIFAPYFVAGAIFSGCALVMTLLIPLRKWMHIEDLVTPWHLDNLAKIILLTSLIVTYSYIMESFFVFYAQDPIEKVTYHFRYFGPEGWMFWMMVTCNCIVPLFYFSPRLRTNTIALWIIAGIVNIGMWTERFVIIAGSLATNFEPSQWGFFHPSFTEIMMSVGIFGFFLMFFSLFARYLPIVSMTELKEGVGWLKQALREAYPPPESEPESEKV